MSFHNQPSPKWHPYHQNQRDNIQQDNHHHPAGSRNKSGNQGAETQLQGPEYGAGMLPGYNMFPVRDINKQGQYNTHSTYPVSSYDGITPDMQSMMQMMTHLKNQMDQLNQLIMQNNRLLQSIHDQEDTKCVQGSGGGAVIVRM
ncbi:hypothetical protein [Oceanobacillus neutriphilus]|uniref:YkzH n=1 Tax=Oceanobacillus neutriphilus TaxID=531815 RepID=A0ABQ2NQC1_9BACI|nr:hypothetical protein [Oceanobacillus neutriphilus]GGP09166.1 hypothetical protein GCM10011346_12130 [Oceanobacillus neutriphilus]